MTTPEGKVKVQVKKILKCFSNVFYFMPVSGGYGKHGIQDYVCCVAGNFLGIECKAGDNELTRLQEKTRDEIYAAGGWWLMVNEKNIDELPLALIRLGAIRK